MEPTGEHFSPLKTSIEELEINLDRYLFVLPFIQGKTILDLGCGCGLATYFYSLFAKKVYAVDYNMTALEETMKFPFPHDNVEYIHFDLDDPKDWNNLPEVDVCVAMEVLEHLENPQKVLEKIRAKRLVFSVPLHSMEMSKWHKYNIETVEDVIKLVGPYYDIGKLEEQGHGKSMGKWVRGDGIRILQ